MRIVRYIFIALLIIVLLAAAGFVIWAQTPLGPMPEAEAALQSDPAVQVQMEPWISFTPQESPPNVGFIFYPGARVDPRSYAPVARDLAELGYLVVIQPMPLNLAFFDVNAAQEISASYPEIESWAIGGHSLGGVAAASFVASQPQAMDALLFWASYPTEGSNLPSIEDLQVASIYGSNDGLTTLEDIENSRNFLPVDTEWVSIEGGNHAQFGWYGSQPGDGEATISRETQQAQIVHATRQVLQALSAANGR